MASETMDKVYATTKSINFWSFSSRDPSHILYRRVGFTGQWCQPEEVVRYGNCCAKATKLRTVEALLQRFTASMLTVLLVPEGDCGGAGIAL